MAHRRIYGLSTSLWADQRLSRDHLREAAAAGFTAIDLAANTTHFAFQNESNVADLQGWLAEAGLTLTSVQALRRSDAPTRLQADTPSVASPDREQRERAVADVENALFIARRIAFKTLILRLDAVRQADGSARSSRDGARRSIEALAHLATPLGVSLAVVLGTDSLSAPRALAHFVDDLRDTADVGICLDFGQGHLAGDLIEAIDTVSEHVATVHLNDNRGRSDERLVPFEGTIDWPSAITTLQKIGYDGPLMFDLDGRRGRADVLTRAQHARRQMERLFAD